MTGGSYKLDMQLNRSWRANDMVAGFSSPCSQTSPVAPIFITMSLGTIAERVGQGYSRQADSVYAGEHSYMDCLRDEEQFGYGHPVSKMPAFGMSWSLRKSLLRKGKLSRLLH